MGKYLLIESRDPFDSQDSLTLYNLALGLARRGNTVVVFLVQNGVFPARAGSQHAPRLSELSQHGVTLLADAFSVRERAIRSLAEGVHQAEIDELVDLTLEPGCKAIWH